MDIKHRLIALALVSLCMSHTARSQVYLEAGTTLCTGTCSSFAFLDIGSFMSGALFVDNAPNSVWDASNVSDYELEYENFSVPSHPGPDPALINPFVITPAVATVAAAGGGLTTGGTVDAFGQWTGTLLLQFVMPPFSDNDAWLILELLPDREIAGKICLFFTTAGCISVATEAVNLEGVQEFFAPIAVIADPPEVEFGDIDIGASAQRVVTFTNTDTVWSVDMRDGADLNSPFDYRFDRCAHVILAPGESCEVNIKFQPVAPGLYVEFLGYFPFPSEGGESVRVTGSSMQPDGDGDGIIDVHDNCTVHANALQRDTDQDNYGNRCDADLNGDCVTNAIDLGLFKAVFFTADADADFDGDGSVNSVDLGIFKQLFFAPPGPSSFTSSCGT